MLISKKSLPFKRFIWTHQLSMDVAFKIKRTPRVRIHLIPHRNKIQHHQTQQHKTVQQTKQQSQAQFLDVLQSLLHLVSKLESECRT